MSISKTSAKKQLQLAKQYLNKYTADVFFICGDEQSKETIPAHKFILATFSDAFETMFYGSLPERSEIQIPDASPIGFRTFLRYFYFDEYMLNIDVIGEAIYLAKKYLVDEYLDACCEFLKRKTTPKNILIGYELAIHFDLCELKKILEWKIFFENNLVFGSEYICNITRDLLKHILQISWLKCSAKEMFDACMAWTGEACKRESLDATMMQHRREQLGDCFEDIEFGAMNRNEITQCVHMFGDLFTAPELQRLFGIVAAKYPIPFQENEMVRCDIGEKAMIPTEIAMNSMDELRFIPRCKMLLGGIEIAGIFHEANIEAVKLYFLVTVSKVSSAKGEINETVLLRYPLAIISAQNAADKNFLILFSEAIVLEPRSSYIVQINLFERSCDVSCYHMKVTTLSEDSPISVMPETNINMIPGLHYKCLNDRDTF